MNSHQRRRTVRTKNNGNDEYNNNDRWSVMSVYIYTQTEKGKIKQWKIEFETIQKRNVATSEPSFKSFVFLVWVSFQERESRERYFFQKWKRGGCVWVWVYRNWVYVAYSRLTLQSGELRRVFATSAWPSQRHSLFHFFLTLMPPVHTFFDYITPRGPIPIHYLLDLTFFFFFLPFNLIWNDIYFYSKFCLDYFPSLSCHFLYASACPFLREKKKSYSIAKNGWWQWNETCYWQVSFLFQGQTN